MKLLQKSICWLMIMSLLLPLTGCSGQEALTEEAVFVKTIHDFGDLRVDQLTEAEDTNFVVYAEGTQEIISTAERNTVLAVDTENLCYTFANPDEQLLDMEPGDVFWAPASEENPIAVTVKLKKMETSGNTVKVYSEEISLEDLFVYTDILLEVPGAETAPEASGLVAGGEVPAGSGEMPQSGGETEQTTPAENASDPTENPAGAGEDSGDGSADNLEDIPELDKTFQLNASREHKLSITRRGTTITGTMGGTLHSVTVKFRYDQETESLFTAVWCDYSTFNSIGVKFSGTAIEDKIKVPDIYVAVGGIYNVLIQPTFNYRFSGEIEMRTQTTESWRKGFLHDGPVVGGVNQKIEEQLAAPHTETVFEALSGSLELGLELRPTLNIGLIGGVYTSLYAGLEFEGSYSPLDETNQPSDDSFVHDCDLCIDGDLNLRGRVSCGLYINLKTKKGLDKILPELTLAEGSVKLKDFYIRRDPVEWGWGQCPHLRWKTTITMLDVNGDPAAGGTIRTTYPDGREASTGTDESGVGILYLPNGDNEVKGAYNGQSSSTNIHIDGEPATATLRLSDERQIFVVYRFLDLSYDPYIAMDKTHFSEAYELIYQAYPDAVWVDSDEWNGYQTQSDSAINGASLEKHQEVYGLSPGDIVISIYSSFFGNNRMDQWSHTYESVLMQVGMVVYPQADSEEKSNAPCVINTYHLNTVLDHENKVSDDFSDLLLVGAMVNNLEQYWKGLQYDEDYRVTEIGTGWTDNEWSDPVTTFGAGTVDEFYQNEHLYRPIIANYITRAFPTIELLLEDEWNDHQDNLIPTEPAAQP